MKLTLDHNVIINLANGYPNLDRLRGIIANRQSEVYVVEIGASEMRRNGVRPERFDLFEELLDVAGIRNLPRLMPIMMFDVTFWDHGILCDDEMSDCFRNIESILFGNLPQIDITDEAESSAKFRNWLNRVCDIQTMWCHLHYKNDVFVTSDRNFHKETKLTRLLDMGAGKISKPEDL